MPDELDTAIVHLAEVLGQDPIELRYTLALLVRACIDGSSAANALERMGLTAHLAKLAPQILGLAAAKKDEPS